MQTRVGVGAAVAVEGVHPVAARLLYRSPEWVVIAYFLLAAVRVHAARQHPFFLVFDLLVPLAVTAVAMFDRRNPRRSLSIVRDWIPMPLLLAAYLNVEAVTTLRDTGTFEHHWIALDRLILNGLHLRSIVESLGAAVPAVLELCYLSLYALPPVLLGVIYASGWRRSANRYLFTLVVGAMTAYTLMPLFPSVSPRIAFPGQDLPSYFSRFRAANVSLLDRFDIHASVFPSGHVAVAFSTAFGFLRVASGRRRLAVFVFVFATLVAVGTLYGRYHFAIDGIASVALAAAAFAVSLYVEPRN